MRECSQLGLVTFHRFDFAVQTALNIQPGIRNKRAGIGPFRTAGSFESEDRLKEFFLWPQCNKRSSKQHVVIVVNVSTILTVHDSRSDFPNDVLKWRDDFRKPKSIQFLINILGFNLTPFENKPFAKIGDSQIGRAHV